MSKTREMERVERVTGRDVRALILDAVEQTGDIAKAAETLGLSTGGLYSWIRRLGGEVQSEARVTFADFAPAAEAVA